MKKLFLLMIVAVLLISACGDHNVQPTTATPTVTPTPQAQVQIAPVTEEPFKDGWNVIGETECDVTQDGSPDAITLFTTAQQEKGQWVFDDSQSWGLEVVTEEGTYSLFEKHLHGVVYMDVSEFYQGDKAIPVISLYFFSGAGVEIRQYTYQNGVFLEETAFSTADQSDAGINRIYSTVSNY